MPYQLGNLFRGNKSITKEDLFQKSVEPGTFAKVNAAIAKWAEERGKQMYGHIVLTAFLPDRFLCTSSFRGVISRSTQAHRLSLKAYRIGGQDMQISVLLAVFKAYFEEAKDIADTDLLSNIAEKNNLMSRDEVRQIFLPS